MAAKNYLETELDELLLSDTATWEFLLKGTLDGVWYWDLEHPEHEWMSPEFWRLFGIDPATKTHNSSEWQDIIFKEDLEVALENFHAHCADPDCPYDQIVRYRHADGSTVWVRCRGLAVRDETGKAVRMLGAHTDLTATKRSEESARAGWSSAETANLELKSFAYSVSHDIKAPANTLSLLLSELEVQTAGKIDEEAAELLAMGRDTVSRMQNLVEEVLDYTRVIGMDSVFEMVDLKECADFALSNLNAMIADTKAEITIGPMPEISAIRLQVNLMFQNLLSNAIKFQDGDEPPKIEVTHTYDQLNDTVVLQFSDNGIGIDPQNTDRIFGLFHRLHDRTQFNGTGLGLPLCHRVALNHYGTISVDSTVGQGSTFAVTLRRNPV